MEKDVTGHGAVRLECAVELFEGRVEVSKTVNGVCDCSGIKLIVGKGQVGDVGDAELDAGIAGELFNGASEH